MSENSLLCFLRDKNALVWQGPELQLFQEVRSRSHYLGNSKGILFLSDDRAPQGKLAAASWTRSVGPSCLCQSLSFKVTRYNCSYQKISSDDLCSNLAASIEISGKLCTFDISMKFGTLIAVTNTNIFRYSAKLDVHGF